MRGTGFGYVPGIIDPDKYYCPEEVAAICGVDSHLMALTMQFQLLKSVPSNGWIRTKGAWILEWEKEPLFYEELPDVLARPSTYEPTARRKPAPPPPVVEEPKYTGPVIYFARCGKHIKIGFTRGKVERRLKGIDTANPKKVVLLAVMPGGQDAEREIHARFAEHRIKGEWFVFAASIREFVAGIRA